MFDDENGWVVLDGLLTAADARALAAACDAALADVGTDVRVGDKQHSGTHRLVDLPERVAAIASLLADERLLAPVHHVVGPDPQPGEVTYRCPQPGFGGQRLHADDLPMLTTGPAQCATAIVTLVDFTPDNGATRVVPGSHRRPDLQRFSGNLEDHPDEVTLTGPAGTAFVFSGHLLHSGTTNRSATPRPAIQITWRRT